MNNNNTLKNYLYINVIYFSERGYQNERYDDENKRDDQNDNRSECYRKTQAAYGSFLECFKTAGQNLLAAFDPNEQNRTSTTDGNYLDKSPKHNYNKKQHICII